MRLAIFAAAFCTLILFHAATVWSCSCAAPPPPKEALEKSAAVFSGKVTKIEEQGFQKRVTIEIARTWKGTEGKSVVVETPKNGAICGYGFEVGQSYLVYCYGSARENNAPASFRTSLCTRTAALDAAAADLEQLGEGRAPE